MKADDVVNKILLTALHQFYKEWPFRINISYAELGVKYPEDYFLMNNDMPEVKEYHLNYELLETTIESLKRESLITFSSKSNENIYDAGLTADTHTKLSLVLEYNSKCQTLAAHISDSLKRSDKEEMRMAIELLLRAGLNISLK